MRDLLEELYTLDEVRGARGPSMARQKLFDLYNKVVQDLEFRMKELPAVVKRFKNRELDGMVKTADKHVQGLSSVSLRMKELIRDLDQMPGYDQRYKGRARPGALRSVA
jgi:hypothetical protein